MTNPASDLFFLLRNWQVVANGDSVHNTREIYEQTDAEWKLQVRAAELLGEVNAALEGLALAGQDVDHYREYFVSWARAVFLPDYSWSAGMQGTTRLYENHVLAMLRATADLLERTSAPVSVSVDSKELSLNALDQIVSALKDAPLNESVRRYVFELLASCRTVLQEAETLDSVDLFARIHELVGVLTVLTESMMKSPDTSPWAARIRDLASQLAPYIWVSKATGFALDAAANFQQLTDGS